jgi:KDO2-lipid IV(A) lauroyltransferase
MVRRRTPRSATVAVNRRIAAGLKAVVDAVLGIAATGIVKTVRLLPLDATSNFAARFMRRVGPWLPEHRVGRANLKAAFPEKSDAEIEAILLGVWDNLGRVGAEFAHIDRLWDYDEANPGAGRVMEQPETVALVRRILASGQPVLCFSAHLANWELPAVAIQKLGIHATVLFRPPNLPSISQAIVRMRAGCMGTLIPASLSAPVQLAQALERGSHVGMLVDQYYSRGVPVTFFGRRTLANPLIARLARHVDCPVHGVRTIRHPGNRFEFEGTEAIAVRDAKGRIDVNGTMQAITDVIEGWVREHPEQWLWLHRRWRDD